MANLWRFQSSFNASGTAIRKYEESLFFCAYETAGIVVMITKRKFDQRECRWKQDPKTSSMTH